MSALLENLHLSREAYQHYVAESCTYAQYMNNMKQEIDDKIVHEKSVHLPINWQRSTRIVKSIKLLDEVQLALNNLQEEIIWLVISEHWCGDSAQILPVMHAFAEASHGKILLKVVYRDAQIELIDAHLTHGARAIPKLIQLDKAFKVLNVWGPRPQEAQDLVKELRANPATHDLYAEHLHKWYAVNKTLAIQTELLALLKQI